MKRVLFAFVFASILLSFGLANALTFEVSVPATAFWDDGGTPTIKAGATFNVNVGMDNPDGFDRTGMSIPWTFYMTGDATTWGTTNPVGVNGFEVGSAWWALLNEFAYWSWDGAVADTVNWTGSGIAGMPNGTPMATRFTFTFTAPSFATLDLAAVFCMDSCSIPGQVPAGKYDWLFEDPVPSFGGPYCFPIKRQPNENAYFTNCPAVELSAQFHVGFNVDLNATEAEGDTPYEFVMVSGPGAINATSGVWTFNPTCAEVGSHDVVVGVADAAHPGEYNECAFTINF
jgi:hypothetical protein